MEKEELPPLWALDMAVKASGFDCSWQTYCDGPGYGLSHSTTQSIIAHARTLAADSDRYKPVDPADEQRWKDAREAAGLWGDQGGYEDYAKYARDGKHDTDSTVLTAYIALCNRDGVTPNLGGKK